MEHSAQFKFKFVKGGHATSFVGKNAVAEAEQLRLAGEVVQYSDIVDTTTRDSRVLLALRPSSDLGPKCQEAREDDVLVLEVSGGKARELERIIDRHASRFEVAARQRQAEEEGRGHLFRTIACPSCEASVDLSEVEWTQFVYCRYCESILQDEAVVTRGDTYRTCDECGMFDRIDGYTEFYFYFLLVVYGFSHKRRHLCPNCAGRLFWKVLLLNFIFVIGIPSALWMKLKSMRSGDADFDGLARANALSGRGEMLQAAALYREITQRFPEHPGLLYNEGVGHLKSGDVESAVQCFERSIRSCGNYEPTLRAVYALQQVE